MLVSIMCLALLRLLQILLGVYKRGFPLRHHLSRCGISHRVCASQGVREHGSKVTTAAQIIRRKARGGLHRLIVGDLGQWQVFVPIVMTRADIRSQDIFKRTVCSLSLSICLWVVTTAHLQFGSEQLLPEATPQMGNEA